MQADNGDEMGTYSIYAVRACRLGYAVPSHLEAAEATEIHCS